MNSLVGVSELRIRRYIIGREKPPSQLALWMRVVVLISILVAVIAFQQKIGSLGAACFEFFGRGGQVTDDVQVSPK